MRQVAGSYRKSVALLAVATCLGLLAACGTPLRPTTASAVSSSPSLTQALRFQREAATASRQEQLARLWMHCAAAAYQAVDTLDRAVSEWAIALNAQCSERLVGYLLEKEPSGWTSGEVELADEALSIQLRGLSPSLAGPPRFKLARKVSDPGL
jgi:hypothetical protein